MKHNGIRGMVIYPFVLFADPVEDVPDWVFKHEMEHVYQFQEMGHFQFYTKFLYYQIRYGYKHNPLEIEARTAQVRPLTELEEELIWKLRSS